MIGSIGSERGRAFRLVSCILFPMVSILLLLPLRARAGDPLDEVDGTEDWDQVVVPAPQKEVQQPQTKETLQHEIAQWESIRITWEAVRKQFLHEKALQKKMSLGMRRIPTSPPLHIDDSNLDQVNDEDWGDAPGEQWLVPAGAVDKAIDSEINESTPKTQPKPAYSAPAPIVPPPVEDHENVPSAFKQEKKQDLGGGLAPGPADLTSPVPPPPPEETKKKDDADAGAKAAAEMLRRQQEEKRRKQEELEAKQKAEAEAGAAAAARLLKLQQERKRKEQEELRKKEGVKVDEEGQVVDPDLQEEMNDDDSE